MNKIAFFEICIYFILGTWLLYECSGTIKEALLKINLYILIFLKPVERVTKYPKMKPNGFSSLRTRPPFVPKCPLFWLLNVYCQNLFCEKQIRQITL